MAPPAASFPGSVNYSNQMSASINRQSIQAPVAISSVGTSSKIGSESQGGGHHHEDDDEEEDVLPQQAHVKRPPNSWILYRQAHAAAVKEQNPGIHNSGISTIISATWRNLSEAEKQPWVDMAIAKKQEHDKKNPDYKYHRGPNKSGVGRKRRASNQFSADEQRDRQLFTSTMNQRRRSEGVNSQIANNQFFTDEQRDQQLFSSAMNQRRYTGGNNQIANNQFFTNEQRDQQLFSSAMNQRRQAGGDNSQIVNDPRLLSSPVNQSQQPEGDNSQLATRLLRSDEQRDPRLPSPVPNQQRQPEGERNGPLNDIPKMDGQCKHKINQLRPVVFLSFLDEQLNQKVDNQLFSLDANKKQQTQNQPAPAGDVPSLMDDLFGPEVENHLSSFGVNENQQNQDQPAPAGDVPSFMEELFGPGVDDQLSSLDANENQQTQNQPALAGDAPPPLGEQLGQQVDNQLFSLGVIENQQNQDQAKLAADFPFFLDQQVGQQAEDNFFSYQPNEQQLAHNAPVQANNTQYPQYPSADELFSQQLFPSVTNAEHRPTFTLNEGANSTISGNWEAFTAEEEADFLKNFQL
ncbi:hypothetical protein NUW58_g8317 [Xylaria curta]|uniref:Uncharacterized protein n=1 Tax=Xylaria curta TaxID=42375 RepID=A0ACC1N971_9PEZI|nr:hypothetical protein NUW58_g8317 [Xylaria curta]